jgi:hypothetical protein
MIEAHERGEFVLASNQEELKAMLREAAVNYRKQQEQRRNRVQK